MTTLFISQNIRDSERVAELRAWLAQHDIESIFLAYDPEDGIPAGRDWEQELYRQIRRCHGVLVVCSQHWAASKWCFAEVAYARALGKKLFPVKVEPCAIPDHLQGVQFVDMTAGAEIAYRKLERGLLEGLQRWRRWDSYRCPYPGLQAFEEADGPVFFGRDEAIFSAMDQLRRQLDGRGLVLFLGASGSGKSSLVRAGILPELRRDSANWLVIDPFRPGRHPAEELSRALSSAFGALGQPRTLAAIAEVVARGNQEAYRRTGIRELIDDLRRASNGVRTIVLVVDQLEELLVSDSPNEAPGVLRQLREVIEDEENRVIVLGTLRSDMLGVFQNHPLLRGLLFDEFPVGPLSSASYREVIEKPAEVSGTDLEAELVDALIADTGSEYALPLLAFTLHTLWEHSKDAQRSLTLRAYRDLGGLEGSVRRVADDLMRRLALSPLDEQNLRRAFVAMTRVNEAGQYAARTVHWQDLPPGSERVLKHFIDRRLLVSDENGTVRVAHDTLLRTWPRLTEWLDADHLFLLRRQRFERELEQWRESRDFLLEGVWLADAEAIAAVGDPIIANADAQEWLDQSRAKRDERQQQERERAQALERALGESEQRFAVSESQRLAFAARAAQSQPETALLLASEAVRWNTNPISEGTLRDALDAVTWTTTVLAGHSDDVNTARFSPDGRTIVTASDDRTARLWDLKGRCKTVLRGHRDRVVSATFSSDGRLVLTCSRDGTARLWTSDGQPTIVLTCDVGAFRDPHGAFSRDGQYVLVADTDGAWLWTAQGTRCSTSWDVRERVRRLIRGEIDRAPVAAVRALEAEGHNTRIQDAVFSPDGHHVVTVSDDRTAQIWNVDGKRLAVLRGHTDIVVAAAVSPDGTLVATGSLDKTARLWTLAGEAVAVLRGHQADVMHLAFTPDSEFLITAVGGGGTRDTVGRVWNRQGKLMHTFDGHTDWIRSLAISPDGSFLATSSNDRTVRVWTLSGESLAVFQGHDDIVDHVTFGPDSETLLSGSFDGTARTWRRSASLLPAFAEAGQIITGAVYSPDGRSVLISTYQGTTRLYSATGERLATFGGKANLMQGGYLTPDWLHLLTLRSDRSVGLWALPSAFGDDLAPVREYRLPESIDDLVSAAQLSPNNERILATGRQGGYLWRSDGGFLAALRGSNLPETYKSEVEPTVDHVMFDPRLGRVVTASKNGMIWVWSEDGDLLTRFLVEHYTSDNVFDVALSPDGEAILTTVRQHADLWDYDGNHLVRLPCQTNKVKRGVFSPDGARIVTVAESARPDVRLWDHVGNLVAVLDAYPLDSAPIIFHPATNRLCLVEGNGARIWQPDGTPLASLIRGSEGWIKYVAFSADANQLLTASTDKTAQLWSIPGGVLLNSFKGHESEVNSAVFSPDGDRVLTASSDGTARQFVIGVEGLVRAAALRVGRGLTGAEITRFNVRTPLRFEPLAIRREMEVNHG